MDAFFIILNNGKVRNDNRQVIRQALREDTHFDPELGDTDHITEEAYYRTWLEADGSLSLTVHPYNVDIVDGQFGMWVKFYPEWAMPCHFDCPYEMLSKLSEPNTKGAEIWRSAVEVYHKTSDYNTALKHMLALQDMEFSSMDALKNLS